MSNEMIICFSLGTYIALVGGPGLFKTFQEHVDRSLKADNQYDRLTSNRTRFTTRYLKLNS